MRVFLNISLIYICMHIVRFYVRLVCVYIECTYAMYIILCVYVVRLYICILGVDIECMYGIYMHILCL